MLSCKKKLSIVIVTYNSNNLIKDCLKCIFDNNDIGSALEVIVVDNNSTDYVDMSAYIKRNYASSVILKRNTRNGGYGQGNNIGIQAASAPVILIMNPDVRLFIPIFQQAIQKFSDIDLGILGIRQYEKKNLSRQSFIPLSQSITGLLLYKLYTLLQSYSSRFFCIHGSCFFIRKEAIEAIGGFDENIFLYNEEMDIHYRLIRQNKYSVKYEKTLSYIHSMHDRKKSLKELQQCFSSYIYVCEKMSLNKHVALDKYINLYRFHSLRSLFNRDVNTREVYSAFIYYLLQQKKAWQ